MCLLSGMIPVCVTAVKTSLRLVPLKFTVVKFTGFPSIIRFITSGGRRKNYSRGLPLQRDGVTEATTSKICWPIPESSPAPLQPHGSGIVVVESCARQTRRAMHSRTFASAVMTCATSTIPFAVLSLVASSPLRRDKMRLKMLDGRRCAWQ